MENGENYIKSDNPDYVFSNPGVLVNVNNAARAKYMAAKKQNDRILSLEEELSEIKYLLKQLVESKV